MHSEDQICNVEFFFNLRRYLRVYSRDQETKKIVSEFTKVDWHIIQYSNWAADWTTNEPFDSC
jgi:hypothetical protein